MELTFKWTLIVNKQNKTYSILDGVKCIDKKLEEKECMFVCSFKEGG